MLSVLCISVWVKRNVGRGTPTKIPEIPIRALRKRGAFVIQSKNEPPRIQSKVVFSYPFFDERSKKTMEFLKSLFEKGALTWEQFQQAAKDAKLEVVNAAGGVDHL